MSRKLAVILIAIAVAMAFAASMAVAGDPPDQVTVTKTGEKKSAVTFSHVEHAKSIDCLDCHHESKTKEEIKKCVECHGKDANAPSGKDAFHDQCQGCHKEQAKGPTKCKECHP
jgi:hypothetical protein